MKKVIITKGLPASGKSTYAKKLLDENPGMYKRLNKDDLRAMLDNSYYTDANEKFIERVRDLMLKEALKSGKHVVIDDTNLADRPVERIKNIVKEYMSETKEQVEVVIEEFDTNYQECIDRDKKRENKVGANVILRMHKQHILGDERGPHYQEQNSSLPHCIISDLDGTLAIMKDRQGYDDMKCDQDELNVPIAEIIRTYEKLGAKIIFMSGRQDRSRELTTTWLNKHGFHHFELFMRKTGDSRKDSIVKKELYEANVKDKYFVKFVLDDRDQVVHLWRLDLGLPCLQVNYGDF